MVSNILTSSQNAQLFSIGQTQQQIDAVQSRLASGLRVTSALDNPQNFFTSRSLSQEASNLSRVLDGIGQSIRTIQETENGLSGLRNIVQQAGDLLNEARETINNNRGDVGELILADDPVIYYRFDETNGTVANNLGSGGTALNGIYQSGVTQNSGELHLGINNSSARFDGVDDRVAIPNNALVNTSTAGYAERSVELTFEANALGGRQVLFEEGGTGNAAAIYLDGDQIYFVARDAGDFGPFDISAEVEEGEVYQAAFVLDANEGTFTGYLNGEVVGEGSVNRPLSRHGGAVAIGRNAGGTFFHDGANGGNGEYFNGRISDFALHNSVLSQETLQERFDATQLDTSRNYEQQVTEVLDQLNPLVEDVSFRGVNLLAGDNLSTYFNNDSGSSLLTEGYDFSSLGLGIGEANFQTFNQLDQFSSNLNGAIDSLERFGSGLSADLNIIESREDYTNETINTFETGSVDLIIADQDEEAANLLALQTRQNIQIETLSLSAQGSNIGDLLSASSVFNT
jgi:flagellin-like hook-associated protein FlgL